MTDKIIEVLEEFYDERSALGDRWLNGELNDVEFKKEKQETYLDYYSRLSSLLDIQKLLDGLPDIIQERYELDFGVDYMGSNIIKRIYYANYFDLETNRLFEKNIQADTLLEALRQLTDKLKENNLL